MMRDADLLPDRGAPWAVPLCVWAVPLGVWAVPLCVRKSYAFPPGSQILSRLRRETGGVAALREAIDGAA